MAGTQVLVPAEPLEADIQSAILELLARHSKVAWAGRINSGAAMLPGKGGKLRPVRFNSIEGISDIIGQMADGRFLAIEVKRPSWRKPSDEREKAQAAFLGQVLHAGGVAFFARSVDEVLMWIAK